MTVRVVIDVFALLFVWYLMFFVIGRLNIISDHQRSDELADWWSVIERSVDGPNQRNHQQQQNYENQQRSIRITLENENRALKERLEQMTDITKDEHRSSSNEIRNCVSHFRIAKENDDDWHQHTNVDESSLNWGAFQFGESTQSLRKSNTCCSYRSTAVTDAFHSGVHSIRFKLANTQGGLVFFGLSPAQGFSVNWDPPQPEFNGVAYFCEDGSLYLKGKSYPFGPSAEKGDVITITVRIDDDHPSLSTVTFSKNDREIGTKRLSQLFDWDQKGLVFTVSLYTFNDEVRVV